MQASPDDAPREPRARLATTLRRGEALVAAVALTGLTIALVATFCSTRFETNDDVSMMMMSSGMTTGTPEPQLFFTHIAIGKPLAMLYAWAPAIDWYPLYLYALHGLGLAALLYVFLSFRGTPLHVVAAGLLVVLFEIRALLLVHFTTTAALLAVAGLLLIASRQRLDGDRGQLTAGIALVLLGALVRTEALYLVVLACAPLFAYLLLRGSWNTNCWLAAAVGIAVVVVWTSYALRSDEWKEYAAYNQALAALLDFARYRDPSSMANALNAAGWSPNDFEMLYSWFFTDASLYGREQLEAFARSFPASGKPHELVIQSLVDEATRARLLIAAFACNVAGALLVIRESRARCHIAVVAGTIVVTTLALVVYLAWFLKLETHVTQPLLFCAHAVFLFTVLLEISSSHAEAHSERPAARRVGLSRLRPIAATTLVAVYATVLFMEAQQLRETEQDNRARATSFSLLLEMLATLSDPKREAPIFVAWGTSFPFEWLPALSVPARFRELNFLQLAGATHGPVFRAALRRHGIDDVYTALFERDDLFLVAAESHIRLFQDFVLEHYGRKVGRRTVNRNPMLFKMVPARPDGS